MDKRCSQVLGSVSFGTTTVADGVPDMLAPADGPVYLEGRLVLSLSFHGRLNRIPHARGDLLETYRIWDDAASTWYGDPLVLRRYELADVIVRSGVALWAGALDARAPIIARPDIDSGDNLRWRRV